MINKILLPVCVGSMALLLLGSNLCFSQEITVTNVSYSVKDSNIVVHYDLSGPADKECKVQVILRRETQAFFKMSPKSVTGDVGTGNFFGENRQIVWHLYEDVPYGLDGNDYYFEINATLLGAEKGGASWLYYAGGALIVGGAAVYFGGNLFKKNGTTSQFPFCCQGLKRMEMI